MTIKLKKFFVIALALISVIVLSILPASALSDEYSSKDFYQVDYIQSFLDTDEKFNSNLSQFPFYVTKAEYNSSNSSYFLTVLFFDNVNDFYINQYDQIYAPSCKYYLSYKFNNNSYYFDDESTMNYTYFNNSDNLIFSNVDLKYSDGTVFFQKPLSLLERLYNQVPQGVGEKITTDLATLTISGVSCLALLIGLALLPKVLYKFL